MLQGGFLHSGHPKAPMGIAGLVFGLFIELLNQHGISKGSLQVSEEIQLTLVFLQRLG